MKRFIAFFLCLICLTAPALADGLSDDTVLFGSYEQDGNEENGPEPIEWLVMDRNGDRELLLSRYILAYKPYNAAWVNTTWATCTLRGWLNIDFLQAAFTPEEQERILLSSVSNADSEGYSGFDSWGGDDTQDKVFLLSYRESLALVGEYTELAAGPTAAAIAGENHYINAKGMCWWWRRSPGLKQNRADYCTTAGANNSMDVNNMNGGVRPAIWVRLGR